jgi:hypothetical protein
VYCDGCLVVVEDSWRRLGAAMARGTVASVPALRRALLELARDLEAMEEENMGLTSRETLCILEA